MATITFVNRRRGIAVLCVAALCVSANGCIVFGTGAAIGAGAGVMTAKRGAPDSRSTTSDGIPTGAAIKVTMTPARDVAGVGAGTGDTTWLRAAHVLIGRIDATSGDTIRLGVTQARPRTGRTESFRRGQVVVTLPRSPDTVVEVISRRPHIVNGVVVGAGTGFLATFAGLWIYCSRVRCLD